MAAASAIVKNGPSWHNLGMNVALIAAITADGFIGRGASHLADWSGSADKKLFVRVTKQLGTMIMGARTFATIGRALPGRRTIVYTHHPEAITAEGVDTTAEDPAVLLARLKAEGATGVAICGGAQIYRLFLEAGLVQELYLTVVPVLFGQGVTLFDHELAASLELIGTEQLDDNAVLLHYKVLTAKSA
jgi:dihydrofolate reductase